MYVRAINCTNTFAKKSETGVIGDLLGYRGVCRGEVYLGRIKLRRGKEDYEFFEISDNTKMLD